MKTTVLTQKIIKAVASAIEGGHTFTYAATLAGVNRKTFFEWRKRGRAASKGGIYSDLNAALEIADAKFIQTSLARISAHGRVSWQAIAWLLERRHPELFGKCDRWMNEQLRSLTEELRQIRAELANRQAPTAAGNNGRTDKK